MLLVGFETDTGDRELVAVQARCDARCCVGAGIQEIAERPTLQEAGL
jgi:hypothetical protein